MSLWTKTILRPVKKVLKGLRDIYDNQRRDLDLQILWPSCKKHADSLEKARRMFVRHMHSDPLWGYCWSWSKQQLDEFIESHLV